MVGTFRNGVSSGMPREGSDFARAGANFVAIQGA
jgi:hypothetical protein